MSWSNECAVALKEWEVIWGVKTFFLRIQKGARGFELRYYYVDKHHTFFIIKKPITGKLLNLRCTK